VGVAVGVGTGVGVAVGVGTGVGVGVGTTGVGVGVGTTGRGVGTGLGLGLGVGAGTGLGVAVGAGTGVGVGFGVGVGVASGGVEPVPPSGRSGSRPWRTSSRSDMPSPSVSARRGDVLERSHSKPSVRPSRSVSRCRGFVRERRSSNLSRSPSPSVSARRGLVFQREVSARSVRPSRSLSRPAYAGAEKQAIHVPKARPATSPPSVSARRTASTCPRIVRSPWSCRAAWNRSRPTRGLHRRRRSASSGPATAQPAPCLNRQKPVAHARARGHRPIKVGAGRRRLEPIPLRRGPLIDPADVGGPKPPRFPCEAARKRARRSAVLSGVYSTRSVTPIG
jgi:hypothetical protein